MPMPNDPSVEESVYDAVQQNPFQPHQPEDVQPTSSSPDPSSHPDSVGGTSGEDVEAAPQEQEQAEEPEQPLEFDPRYRELFTGLLYLGKATKTFEMWHHTFVVRTLTTEEHAEIGLYTARYDGSRAENAVYQSAVVAAAMVSLDGKPLVQPLGHKEELQPKIDFVMKNWMPAVREKVWEEIFNLEAEVRMVLEQMGNASG